MTTQQTADAIEVPVDLHPGWLPWLRRHGLKLSPMAEAYVRDELADRFELDRAPKDLNPHELEEFEEELLPLVRRHIARETKYYGTVRTNNFSLVPYGPELSNHLNEGAFTSPTCKGS